MQVRRPIQAPGARCGVDCVLSLQKVWPISWLGVAEQVSFSTQLSFKDTFLWDAAWSRTHRWVPSQWYSPTKPRVRWRTSLLRCATNVGFADHEEVSCSRVDAWIINRKTKPVITVKMSCLRINNREKKSEEKTVKYAPPPPTLGIKTAVPWLWSETMQHHRWRPWGVVMGSVPDCRGQKKRGT